MHYSLWGIIKDHWYEFWKDYRGYRHDKKFEKWQQKRNKNGMPNWFLKLKGEFNETKRRTNEAKRTNRYPSDRC